MNHMTKKALKKLDNAILYHLLMEPQLVGWVKQYLLPAMFLVEDRPIYVAMEYLDANNAEIDFLTLADHLKKMGQLEGVGGVARLVEIINQ
jgi:replicative DNA helicase